MPRKVLDPRIRDLISNGIQEKKRSFIVIVGDRPKEVIVQLHYIMSSVNIKQNKSVLWAYKKELLGFTSHRGKREAKIKKEIKRGIREANSEDPFELFVTLNQIRYVYYRETDKILGNTFGMCILQDFEAITPNLLARTIETVEGGGLVVLLLKGMKSLKQLYTMSMDVHSRYRTEAHQDVVPRFNERFILSLGSCESCLVVDDELNVLPISGGRNVRALPPASSESQDDTPAKRELEGVKESIAESEPVGSLVKLAKTVDQAKALLTFVEAIAEKTLRSTVTLTAGRGRGKSAALGVAIAAAIAHGYSNIFITSPSPENLKTLFEFVFKGFDTLDYMDHVDYTILQSTNPDFNKAIVRVNVHRQHRQTIQYIQPQDAYALGQAELLVIDEAAAIPLPLVQKLMGPYLVFMASTVNGYEGTGRSLSLKLIQQLREQSRGSGRVSKTQEIDLKSRSTGKAPKSVEVSGGGRSLREITLSEPIRYAQGDTVEKWLNKLLCLDATLPKPKANTQGTPHPSRCELLYVNRDTLFSGHPVSEKFLQQMMALYVASHYKNSPNDLQLMSDAPAHELFVLVPPLDPENDKGLPEPLCVLQVALEGQIKRESVLESLSRGQRLAGDLIPWLVSQQFQDAEFAELSGARVVRIATNPDYMGMGYGSRSLQLLTDFYEGKFANLSENELLDSDEMVRVTDAEIENSNLQDDNIKVRDIETMPPLFSRLSERRPPGLDYIGVSFGLTQPLHRFWKRATFAPVYLRQTPNELTGEHSCVMLRNLSTPSSSANTASLVGLFAHDFRKRFFSLLSYQFRAFPPSLSLSIAESASRADTTNTTSSLTKNELDTLFSPFDLKRLQSCAENMLDYHVILDMVPTIADLYFSSRLGEGVKLSPLQQAILVSVGPQRKNLEDVAKELNTPISQLLAIFTKTVRKISMYLDSVVATAVAESLPSEDAGRISNDQDEIMNDESDEKKQGQMNFQPLEQNMEDELKEGGKEIDKELREKQKALIDALPLDQYEIANGDAAWEAAEKQVQKGANSTMVSVKSSKPAAKRKFGETAAEIYEKEVGGGKSERKAKKMKKGKR